MTGSLQENVNLVLEFIAAKVGTLDVIITETFGEEEKHVEFIPTLNQTPYKVLVYTLNTAKLEKLLLPSFYKWELLRLREV